jgi:hypothetical protein
MKLSVIDTEEMEKFLSTTTRLQENKDCDIVDSSIHMWPNLIHVKNANRDGKNESKDQMIYEYLEHAKHCFTPTCF